MKIAIQLFGHLRTYQKCYKSLQKYLLSHYDCDVFMHTWTTENHCTKTWHKNEGKQDVSVIGREGFLKNAYHLKELIVEKQQIEDLGTFTSFKKEISIFGMASMFHSMKQANALRQQHEKEHHVQYDYVIVLRPDILLKKDFSIESFLENLDEKYIQNSLFTGGFPRGLVLSAFETLGATDMCFFAKPHILDKLYDNQELFLSFLKKGTIVKYAQEYYFIKTLKNIGYAPVFIDYNFKRDFDIMRPVTLGGLRRHLLRLRIRRTGIKLYFLTRLIHQIIHIRFDFFNSFYIDFCIGNIGNEAVDFSKIKKGKK